MLITAQQLFIRKKNNQKSEVSLEGDITFRLFNQLSLDVLFDMKIVFGHLLTEWKDTNKIFGLAVVNHRCFFNLESTILGFRRAFSFLSKALTSYRRTSIMFVSGLPKYDNFSDFLNFHKINMPLLGYGYAIHWVPGILTNFAMLIAKFWGRSEVVIPRYTKTLKRNWFFESVRGMKLFHTFPDFVCFFSTSGIYEIAVKEAFILKIPTIGFVDSDQEVTHVTFPIIGNDDSIMGLEIKIYLFRELILRALKTFLFTEIDQLLIEQSSLQQVVFQTYLSDRFRELLKYEYSRFYLRMQIKTKQQLEDQEKSNFKKKKLQLYKSFFKGLQKLSLFFIKKTMVNPRLLKKKYKVKRSLKTNKSFKFVFIKSVSFVVAKPLKSKEMFAFDFENKIFKRLGSLSLNLAQVCFVPLRGNVKKILNPISNCLLKIKTKIVFQTFFVFVKKFFVLQMFFTFFFSCKFLFTKEKLKLHWAFFFCNSFLKKRPCKQPVNVFLNLLSLYKKIQNFCAYLIQFRMSFFNEYFSIILKKYTKSFLIISEGIIKLEKKFNIKNFGYKKNVKNVKYLRRNFKFHFIRPFFFFTKYLFSLKFYYSRFLKSKKIKQKTIQISNLKKKNNLQLENKKKSLKFLISLTNMLHMNEKNAQGFLAKKLIFWKLYKLKYRHYFSVENKLQKHSFLRFVLQKFNKLFTHFPSLRGFFLKNRKSTKKLKKSNFASRLPWRPHPIWFKFGLKRSLLFFLKKSNVKKKKRRKFSGFLRLRAKSKRKIKSYFFRRGRFRFFRKKVPRFLFKRFHKWLREKPFVNAIFPKFLSPRYPTTPFHDYTDFELRHYQKYKLHFLFNFLNYVKYKKKLLICFFELKSLVNFLLHQKFKFNLFKFLVLFSNKTLKTIFLLLQKKLFENLKTTLNFKFLTLFSKFYNLILLEFTVLFKKSFFMQSSIHFFLLLRFFYYTQKFSTILNINNNGLIPVFLQVRTYFSFFQKSSHFSFFFLGKNIVSNFFNFKRKQKTFIMKRVVKFVKKKRKLKRIFIYQKLFKNRPDYFTSLNGRSKKSRFYKIFNKYLLRYSQYYKSFLVSFKKTRFLKKKYSRLNLLRFFFKRYLVTNGFLNKHKMFSCAPKPSLYIGFFKAKKKRSVFSHIYHQYVPLFKMHKKLHYLRSLFHFEKKKNALNTRPGFSSLKRFNIFKKKAFSSLSFVGRMSFLKFPQKKFSVFYRSCNRYKNKHKRNILRNTKRFKPFKSFINYEHVRLSPKTLFSLKFLKKFENEVRNPKFMKNEIKSYHKKRTIELTFLQGLFRFKENFFVTNFYKYRGYNFNSFFFPSFVPVKKLKFARRRWISCGFRKFQFIRNRGFLVKVSAYKDNFLKQISKKKLNLILKEKKIKFSLISLPIVPVKRHGPKTLRFFFKQKAFFHRDFGYSVKFDFKNKNLLNERKNFQKRSIRRRRILVNKLKYRATIKRNFKLKFKTIGFILKRFRFYYKKLKEILKFFIKKTSKKSKNSVDKFTFLNFFDKHKGVTLLSLLIKKAFFLFLYRMFINFKMVNMRFIKLRWFKFYKNKLILKRINVSSHFNYKNYLKFKALNNKNKMLSILFLFSKLKKAREFYFLKFSKILSNQSRFMRRSFSKKNFQLLKFYY